MTVLNRKSYQKLLAWKTSKRRKPLLIRGARQVGKTTLVRDFSKEFDNYIELNLEKEADRALFEIDDAGKIIDAVFLSKAHTPNNKPTLVFIDEIQESPKAIQQLRYFFEEVPELHIIAAGSLLEFALKQVPSFPVGRVEYLYLYPLNFVEYLDAIGNKSAIDALQTLPIQEYSHKVLLELFHQYAIIGGMPETVSNYVEDKNISSLSNTYNQLWQSYKDDVEKYAKNNTDKKIIRHVIETAPYAKDRIKFEGFGQSNYRSREVGEALHALDLAKIIQLVYPSTSIRPPITPDLKKRPRLQFLDTGMLNQILMLQAEMIALPDLDDFHKGRIIQHLVVQELTTINEDSALKYHFWVREEKNTNSEVDALIQHKSYVIPIEVKAGKQGKLKSLHQFIDRCGHPYALRLYSGKFSIEEAKTPKGTPYYLMNLPYYLTTQIHQYLEYFTSTYKEV